MIGRTVTIDGQEHTLVAIHYRQESSQTTAGHVLLLANGESGQLVEHPIGTQPWSQAFMKSNNESSGLDFVQTQFSKRATPVVLADSLRARIVDVEDHLARSTKMADDLWSAIRPAMPDNDDGRYPPSASGVEQALRDGRIVTDTGARMIHQAEGDLRSCKAELERAERMYKALRDAILVVMPADGDGRYPATEAGFSQAVNDGRIVAWPDRRLEQAIYERDQARAALEQASAERDQAREGHATASDSFAAALADASVERDGLAAKVAKLDNDLRMARDDRGQAEEDAEASSVIIARAHKERDRVRADLAAEIAAHLETKQDKRDLTAELDAIRRKVQNVSHWLGASGDASTEELVAVLFEDQQKLRKSTVDLSSEVAKLTETRRVYEHMIQGIGEVLPVGSPIDVRKAVVQMAAERTAARDELAAIRSDVAKSLGYDMPGSTAHLTLRLVDMYNHQHEQIKSSLDEIDRVRELVTKALGHDARHDTSGLAAKALVSMLVNQYTEVTGHLAWIRARVSHVLGQHGPESTSAKVAMLIDQFGAIQATRDQQLYADAQPLDQRVTVAIGRDGLPGTVVGTEIVKLSDADLETLAGSDAYSVSHRTLSDMACELKRKRAAVSEAEDAKNSVARALGWANAGISDRPLSWSLLIRKADAVRGCRDELVDRIAEMNAEAKRVRDAADAKRVRDASGGGGGTVAMPMSRHRQETPWRPDDASGPSEE